MVTEGITQDDAFPAARGVGWDLRKPIDVAGQQCFQPVDTTTDFFSNFNLDFLRSELVDYSDKALVSQLTTGVDFQIDPGLIFVLFPHLTSLADGFNSVDDEVNKFIEQGLFEVHNRQNSKTDRTIRLLRCWSRLARSMNLVMATAAKRHIGADLVWLGVRHNSALGVAIIPEDKRLRAKKAVSTIAYDDTAGAVADHKQLCGHLGHLLPIVALGRPRSPLHERLLRRHARRRQPPRPFC